MPISVVCPECSARMNAPDELLGKKVKCPKCQSPIMVTPPEYDVIEDDRPAPVRPAKSSKGRSRPERDYDHDDRPRRNKPKPESSKGLILAVGAVLGLILLAGFGVLIWLMTRESPPAPAPVAIQQEPAPAPAPEVEKRQINWVRFDQQGVPFTVDFPEGPPRLQANVAEGASEQLKPLLQGFGLTPQLRSWRREDDGRIYSVITVEFNQDAKPEGIPDDLLKEITGGEGFSIPAGMANLPPRDMLATAGPDRVVASRILAVSGIMYEVRVEGPMSLTLTDEAVVHFFQSFRARMPAVAPKK